MGLILTLPPPRSNLGVMDIDDLEPRKRDDALAALMRQDLDPLSVAELDERVERLEAEIARTKAKRDAASKFRSAADDLFRRK